MSLTSKIAKSIHFLTNTLHQEPSYSFLAAEERKMMLRQQQGTSMFEPDPSSFGRNKFGCSSLSFGGRLVFPSPTVCSTPLFNYQTRSNH